jgi:hypothetical protein
MSSNISLAMDFFKKASVYVETAHLTGEIEWQRGRRFLEFDESALLRESAWVILCSGFREATIRKVFDHISLSFCDWESSQSIVDSAAACRMTALGSFNNKRKIDAILEIARRINTEGFDVTRDRIQSQPIVELQKFPYIGPITAWHLAKNLGLQIAKPDRHLLKLSNSLGYGEDVHKLCASISQASGELVSVVDLILWRYVADLSPRATIDSGYIYADVLPKHVPMCT